MTDDEAVDIFDRLFTAFPSYREWLLRCSDSRKTYDTWRRMLSSVSHADASVAVERIIDGDLEMPEAYERDQLPVRLRSYARRIEQDRRMAAKDQRTLAAGRRTSEHAMPAWFMSEFRTIWMTAQRIGLQVRDHEISKEENDQQMVGVRQRLADLEQRLIESKRPQRQRIVL